MKIGILSDIHGNSTALKAVLEEAHAMEISELFVLGDMVGYYYMADEVFELLSSWKRTVVRGNHEDMMFQALAGERAWEDIRKKYGSGLKMAVDHLSPARVQEIKQYPRTVRVQRQGMEILLAHGSPWSTDQYVYPDADLALKQRCEEPGVDWVFLGHTHYPLYHRGVHSTVVNPGSVGQSRKQGGRAEWGVLDCERRTYTQQSTVYVIDELLRQAKALDPDVLYLQEVLTRSR